MYCTCKSPKSKKMFVEEAFEVCARSLGGCGKELLITTSSINCIPNTGYILNIISSVSYKPLTEEILELIDFSEQDIREIIR